MNDKNASKSVPKSSQTHVVGEDQFLDELRELWIPHRLRDLEVRYQLGELLNKKLGTPAVRQSYGLGTIERVARELDIHKSDISRVRRFAAMEKTFEAFQKKYPAAISWTQVRQLVSKNDPPERSADGYVLQGILRSGKSMVEKLSTDHPLQGPLVDDICATLRELYPLAHAKLGFQLNDEREEIHQTDS